MINSTWGCFLVLLLAADPAPQSTAPNADETQTVVIGAHKFTLPTGLKIDLVAGPPLIERPIHADFDDAGRLFVAESSGSNDPVQKQLREKPHRIVRLEDTDGDGKFDQRTIFADKLMFPAGMLCYAGSVYVAAPPSIWKLTDTNGDGVADVRTEWFQGKTLTGCANDLHGPYLGPDGWIYWCKGAFAEQTYERAGKKPFVTRAAHIFRARPDGTGIEPVMTGGMDNPVELAFTRGGERIFTTTFFQNPAGGKRDGLIHAIYGGVYGKIHNVIDEHPRTGEILQPMTHLGPAAPAGICRAESDRLHNGYKDNLFVAQFNMHKVSRHVLEQAGATFKTRDFDLLSSDNLDFHPTDVLEDADGSFLVVNTGGWYKLCCPSSQLWKPDVLGGIYRIHNPFSDKVRKWIAAPDQPRLPWKSKPEDRTAKVYHQLAALLKNPETRPGVLREAHSWLWRTVLAEAPGLPGHIDIAAVKPELRSDAIWILTRMGGRAASLIRQALTDADEQVAQAALNSISLRRDALAIPQLSKILANGKPMQRRLAAEALGRIGSKETVPHLLQAASDDIPREFEHALIYALIEIGDRSQTLAGLTRSQPARQRVALIALDQMADGGLTAETVAPFLMSGSSVVRETAAWIAGRHSDWGAALAPVLRQRLTSGKFSSEEARDLALQLARFSKDSAIQTLLAEFATTADSSQNTASRRVALQAMTQSGFKVCPDSWSRALLTALRSSDAETVQLAVAALRKLPQSKEHWQSVTAALSQVAAQPERSDQLRLDALSAFPGQFPPLDSKNLKFLQLHLQDDVPVLQRLAAVDVLSKSKLTDEQLIALTESIRTAGPLEIERLLVPFVNATGDEATRKLIDALQNAPALANVRAETIQKLFANRSPAIRQAADAVVAKLSQSTQQQRFRIDGVLALVPKGEVRRGQMVFHSQKAACTACHALGYVGGTIGPDLSRVGRIRSERDLIEAIVYPSASFVRSYEPIIVTTKAGKSHGGLVKQDSPEELVLTISAREEVRLRREEIEEIRPSTVSLMPAGLDQQLTPQELADLIVFLKAAK